MWIFRSLSFAFFFISAHGQNFGVPSDWRVSIQLDSWREYSTHFRVLVHVRYLLPHLLAMSEKGFHKLRSIASFRYSILLVGKSTVSDDKSSDRHVYDCQSALEFTQGASLLCAISLSDLISGNTSYNAVVVNNLNTVFNSNPGIST